MTKFCWIKLHVVAGWTMAVVWLTGMTDEILALSTIRHHHHHYGRCGIARSLLHLMSSHNPNPPNWNSYNPIPDYDNGSSSNMNINSDTTENTSILQGQANTRFSAFAPNDPSLDADEFRFQLKENMKADLERRRREDPNRGNQPAKNYLDSL